MSRFIQYLKKPILADYSHEDIFYLGLLLTPLWFFGNILYNYSLLMTSISSSTVIRYSTTHPPTPPLLDQLILILF